MESHDAPKNSAHQAAGVGFGQAPPRGDVRRLLLATGWSLVLLGLVGLLGWFTGLRPLTSILPQYAPIALYAAVFFVAVGCIYLWHANRAWSSLSFSIAMAASAVISITGFLGVASYFTGVELTLESLIVPPGELASGLPMGHISPVGGVLFALFAPAVWLGLRPWASTRSRQAAAFIALFIAFAGGAMSMGYLMGAPLLYAGGIIPVAALAAVGFVFMGSGLAAAAGDDLVPIRFLTGDSLRARLLRLFLPLSTSLAVVQATAHAAIEASAPDPAVPTALWTIGFLIFTGGAVVYSTGAIGKDYDRAQMERRKAMESLRESEAFVRAVMDSLPIGIAVNSIDPAVKFEYMNDNFPKFYRTTREALAAPDGFWDAIYEEPAFREEMKKRMLADCATGDPELMLWVDVPITRKGEETTFITSMSTPAPGRQLMISTVWDVTQRKSAELEIHKLNVELEQRVIQRTAQLATANKELEAFAYSISHDLRAPLRGIDGWSQALWEDYAGQLDAQARTYINRVRSETQRMGQLIDDILQLSRLTRSEMRTERVNLSAIAQTIAARLQESAPERQVEFAIEKGLTAQGDPRLLEIALSNLLDNAVKFTEKTPHARIEFGQIESQGPRVLFVRDNGAGFDMAFTKKLFGAFQRMHKASEFPGTGIGLTTVQRIIHRHGGRIWAEAAVNQGATFYFTI